MAPTLRDAFAAAAPTLPVSFGAELVQAAAHRRQEDRDPVIGVALGYLFNGPQLPTAFLAPAVRALHDVEVSAAAGRGQDAAEGDGAILWVPTLPPIINSPLLDGLRPDPDAPYLAGRSAALDPVYAMLRQLGRDGAAGRAVFSDRTVAEYFFAERPITEDHGQAVTAAAAAAAATDGVVPSAAAGGGARRDVRRLGVRARLRRRPHERSSWGAWTTRCRRTSPRSSADTCRRCT